MNLNKHLDFFNPIKINKQVHIIGVGAIGSNIATQLTRLGLSKLHIWDFDIVDDHNITNQIYTTKDIGKPKIDALELYLKQINPEIEIYKHQKYEQQLLQGFIFMCVDSVELRKKIIEINRYNMTIDLLIDTRIALQEGQIFTASWENTENVNELLNFCQFKDSEVEIPVSACGTRLSISPTVLITTSYAIANLINYIKEKKYAKQIFFDSFTFKTRAVY